MHEGRAAITTALSTVARSPCSSPPSIKPTAWFGGLLGMTMIVAFLAEVFVLPAIIKLAPRVFSAERIRGEPQPDTAPA